jgi:hypothetical protein
MAKDDAKTGDMRKRQVRPLNSYFMAVLRTGTTQI